MDNCYRVAVVGTRYFDDRKLLSDTLGNLVITWPTPLCIISGGAKGADALAKWYAKQYGIQYAEYPADWDTHGKAAGPKRNAQMAEACHEAVAFWDGKSRGTLNMMEECAKRGKRVLVIGYQ